MTTEDFIRGYLRLFPEANFNKVEMAAHKTHNSLTFSVEIIIICFPVDLLGFGELDGKHS